MLLRLRFRQKSKLSIKLPRSVYIILNWNIMKKGAFGSKKFWFIRTPYFWDTGCPTLKCCFWDGSCDNTIRLTDLQWWFLFSQGKKFWYSCPTFAKKLKEIIKIFIWKKIQFFFGSKIFFEIFQKNFFAINQPKKGF